MSVRSPRRPVVLAAVYALIAFLLAPCGFAQPAWTLTRTGLPNVSVAWSVAYGNGRFVATLGSINGTSAGAAYSTDGLTWRAATTSLNPLGKIVFVSGAFYLAGYGGIVRSTDGDTWQTIYTTDGGVIESLATDGRGLLAAQVTNSNTHLLYSSDLLTWQYTAALPDSLPSSFQPTLGFVNGRYYVHYYTDAGSRAVSSTDGKQWTLNSTLTTVDDLTSGNGRLVGHFSSFNAGDSTLTTTDGTTFVRTNISSALHNGGRMGYAGGRYFFLGSLYASRDGTSWGPLATLTPIATSNMTGIAYGNGRYVAVGNSASSAGVIAVLPATAPPVITTEPDDRSVPLGTRVVLNVAIDNSNLPTTYQWQRNGLALSGATNASYAIEKIATSDFASYRVVLTNSVGTVTSRTATVSLIALPVITAAPVSRTLVPDETALLSVTAAATPPLTYQWYRNGAAVPGATNQTILVDAGQSSSAGTYIVTVTNPAGTVTSNPATITLLVTVPAIISAHTGLMSARPGETFLANVTVTGPAPLTYQWERDGVPVLGATFTNLYLNSVQPSDAGVYRLIITNAFGAVASNPLTLIVTPVSRLSNLSVLTSLSPAGDTFTLGYVVGGVGTAGPKPLIIRAAGPALSALGVGGALDDPKLETFTGSTPTGANDNWGGAPSLSAAFNTVGAFPFASATSRDAAVTTALTTRDNSVQVSAANFGTGLVLAEVYDATPDANFTIATPRLLNVSVLKSIGDGLTVGFTLAGTQPRTILLRAIGPTLGDAPFGLRGVVADPRLTLFNSSSGKITENDNWGGTTALNTAFSSVGAFPLPSNSRDAALLVLLTPGSYTAQVSGVNNTSGIALVEVYEIP